MSPIFLPGFPVSVPESRLSGWVKLFRFVTGRDQKVSNSTGQGRFSTGVTFRCLRTPGVYVIKCSSWRARLRLQDNTPETDTGKSGSES